jgi:hypothetical protein
VLRRVDSVSCVVVVARKLADDCSVRDSQHMLTDALGETQT